MVKAPHESPIRTLMAKSSMDPHNRGLRVVSKALVDAGMEVILHQYDMIEEMVETAAEEDVNVIGLSFYCTGFSKHAPILMEKLKSKEMTGILVIVGGIIPDSDVPELLEAGVSKIFGPGTPTVEIVNHIRDKAKR